MFFWPFPQLGWSIGTLMVHWFHQNTVTGTHRRPIFRPTLWKLKKRLNFPKVKILIFFIILVAFGHVFVLVGIVQSKQKCWWKFFLLFLKFFCIFWQKCDFGPHPKISNTSSKFFPEKWPKFFISTSRLWKHIIYDVPGRQKIEKNWKNWKKNFLDFFGRNFFLLCSSFMVLKWQIHQNKVVSAKGLSY